MITRSEAIDALSFKLDVTAWNGDVYSVTDPLNGDSNADSPYVFDFQYAGNSRPADMADSSPQFNGWTSLNPAEKARFEAMLDYIETYVNVDFQRVSGQADPTMNIGKVNLPGATAGYGGYNFSVSFGGGNNVSLTDYDNFAVFDNGLNLASGHDHLMLHEVLHGLGLKHPFEGGAVLPAELENNKYSIMSYSANPDNGKRSDGPQLFDILALQERWGANLDTATGNNSYTGKRNTTVDTIWDAGGVDTFDASAKTSNVKLSLVEATFSTFDSKDDVAIAYDVVIENAIGGSGNDTITGNDGANNLRGGAGNDVISGGAGKDRVYDGTGNDNVTLGSGNDYVRVGGGSDSYNGGSGKDYISYYDSTGGVTVNLATNAVSGSWASDDTLSGFESISGSKVGGDTITGTSGENTIKTYGGADRIIAGNGDDDVYAGSGNDIVELGAGNDYVRVGGGVENFDGGSGKDYISYYDSSNGIRIDLRDNEISRSWGSNDTIKDFESASGSKSGNDTMLGTNDSNTLQGYGGNDKLYGRDGDDKLNGGSGADRFDGGDGTDILIGGSGADIFHLDFGEGHDIIKDFENNIDRIEFDNFSFGGGNGNGGESAFDFASQVGDDVVFEFGNGDRLTIEDTTLSDVSNDWYEV